MSNKIVLHFGETLPDIRIERAAKLLDSLGYINCYVGDLTGKFALNGDIFQTTYQLKIRPRQLLGIETKSVIDNLKKIITKSSPNYIHAHDIFNFKLITNAIRELKIELPVIYDSHEYWSNQIKFSFNFKFNDLLHPKKLFEKLLMRYKIPKWEHEAITNYPVITVSEQIKEAFEKKGGQKIYVIPNMPLISEVENTSINPPKETENVIVSYLGGPLNKENEAPYRDGRQLLSIFSHSNFAKLLLIGSSESLSNENIMSIGHIPHEKCIDELSKSHIGTQGFNTHPALSFFNPNKVHLYAHAGLMLLLPNNMLENSLIYLKEISIGYNNIAEIDDLITLHRERIINHSHQEIREWARTNIVLDNYLKVIDIAYQNL